MGHKLHVDVAVVIDESALLAEVNVIATVSQRFGQRAVGLQDVRASGASSLDALDARNHLLKH